MELQKHMLIKNGAGTKPQLWLRSRAPPGGMRFYPLCGMPAVSPLSGQRLKEHGKFLLCLLSFAPSHMWASEEEARHSSYQLACEGLPTLV